MISVETSGFTGVDRALAEIDVMSRGEVLTIAAMYGAKVLSDEAERLAPRQSGAKGGVSARKRGSGNGKRIIRTLNTHFYGGSGAKTGFVEVKIKPSKHFRHLIFAETGTRAHTIKLWKPKGFKGLRKVERGRRRKSVLGNPAVGFFGDEVSHPGARMRPFLRPALDTKGAEAVRRFGEIFWAKIRDVRAHPVADRQIFRGMR